MVSDIKLSNTSQQADTAVRDTMNPGVRLSASYVSIKNNLIRAHT